MDKRQHKQKIKQRTFTFQKEKNTNIYFLPKSTTKQASFMFNFNIYMRYLEYWNL